MKNTVSEYQSAFDVMFDKLFRIGEEVPAAAALHPGLTVADRVLLPRLGTGEGHRGGHGAVADGTAAWEEEDW